MVLRKALERPRERPAEPWAGEKGEFLLQKVTGLLHSFTACAPASSPLKGPDSSLGPTQAVALWHRVDSGSGLPFLPVS